MINLQDQIRSAEAERSLFMTYCASLSFFEYALLKSLENAGVATITVLMDAASHQASFCDYVTGAGVRYRIHPVRLHPRAGVFHPKLYLMVSSKRVRLLIASANLTPSGFKSNLEIVDQLELTDENQADAHAFAQYTGMLRSLAGFDVSLPIAVIDELRRVADIVEERILKEPESESGPWFLHSIDEALLPQLVRLVSTDVVRQIVAFSPFFDKDCEAILGLAAAYPKADIRIIKDKEPDDLEGKPLAKLDKRITVEELQESDSEKRHLHAKVLLLRGKSAEWIVSGSANLTRSAWLAAANSKNFGNVEAIVVRAVNKGSMARLLKSIKTTPLDCRKLRWISSSGNDDWGTAGLTIREAELKANQVTILVDSGSWFQQHVTFGVTFEQGNYREEIAPTVTSETGNRIGVRFDLDKRRPKSDFAMVVTLEVKLRSGETKTARTWVAVPSALALTAVQRNTRASLSRFCQRIFIQDDAALVISDAIGSLFNDLGGLSQNREFSINGRHGSKAKDEGQKDHPVSKDNFVVPDWKLGSVAAAGSRAVAALSGLAAWLEKIVLLGEESQEDDAPRDPTDDEDEGFREDEGDSKKRDKDSPKRAIRKAADLLSFLDTAFRDVVTEALKQPVSAEAVPFVVKVPGAAVAYLLMHLRICHRLQIQPPSELMHFIRDTLRNSLSVDGVLVGQPYGWLVRAMSDQESRAAVTNMLSNRDWVGELTAFAATGLALMGNFEMGVAAAQSILAGLHFVTGELPAESLISDLKLQVRKLALAAGKNATLENIENVLQSYEPAKVESLLSASRWSLLLRVDAARANAEPASELGVELKMRSPNLWEEYLQVQARDRDPLEHILEFDSGIVCTKNHTTLPLNIMQQLFRSDQTPVRCPGCRRLLVPLRSEDPTTKALLAWFKPFDVVGAK